MNQDQRLEIIERTTKKVESKVEALKNALKCLDRAWDWVQDEPTTHNKLAVTNSLWVARKEMDFYLEDEVYALGGLIDELDENWNEPGDCFDQDHEERIARIDQVRDHNGR